MFSYLFGASLIACPFILRLTEGASTTRMSKDIWFFTSVILLTLFWKPKHDKYLAFLLSVILWVFYFNTDIFANIYYWTQFQMVAISLLFFYVVATSSLKKDFFLNCLVIIGTITSLWCISCYLNYEPYQYIFKILGHNIKFERYQTNLGVGPLGNTMLSGALIALCTPSLFRRKCLFILPLFFLGILSTSSSMSLVSFLIAIGFYYSKINKYLFSGLMFVGMITLPFIKIPFIFFADNGRFILWKESLKHIKNVWLGNGLGDFPNRIPMFISLDNSIPTQMHNEFLELFYSSGLLGCALIFIPILYIFIKCKNKILLSGILVLLSNSYANFLFHISPLSMIALTYIAMSYGEDKCSTTEKIL